MPVDSRIQAALEAPLRDKPNLVVLPQVRGGYAARPGTGPESETCRTCKHSCPLEVSSGHRFWKCVIGKGLTYSETSDIRLKSPACRKWEARCAR